MLSHSKHGMGAAMKLESLLLIAAGEVITFISARVIIKKCLRYESTHDDGRNGSHLVTQWAELCAVA